MLGNISISAYSLCAVIENLYLHSKKLRYDITISIADLESAG